ncbi:MAG: PTS sugar transporter subunit IIA [Bacteroidales bacterium]|nr:PTS sugar transporter subunit IIA [Bacteroidales bacterium]
MKEKIQKFGRSLSAMVMPNIGAFIAWGLITAIFIPGGWWPNENIAQMVAPMLKYLLPTLIAFTAGKNVGGYRGGVAGAVAAMGVIIGTDTPMFLGAMIMGPIAGWCVKRFDKLVDGKVGAGFEMLVDNFSLGIIAMLLAIAGYLVIGHAVAWITNGLSNGVNWMLAHKMNPLLAVLVDPAKVLFLNNAVNHGIMTPLGIQQAADMGQSMLFLVDPNPGPGLGILLACWAFGKGNTKQSAPGAVVIQLLGGIHEIYFPYVLARPILLLAVMIGNICALSFFTLVDFGLVAPASPGSLISIILMSPKGKTLLGILGVIIGTAVSFLLAWPMVKARPDFQGESENGPAADQGSDRMNLPESGISKIVFACDAGMGSSALGATRFKSRLMKAGLGNIKCTNCAVGDIPGDASVVICQKELEERAAKSGKKVISITNFLSDPALDALLSCLSTSCSKPSGDSDISSGSISPSLTASDSDSGVPYGSISPSLTASEGYTAVNTAAEAADTDEEEGTLLKKSNILTGLPTESKQNAILRAGTLLQTSGYVDNTYPQAMLEREKIATTYMGMGLAIPHGTAEAKTAVKKSGIAVLQYPDGVDFDGEKAHLIVAIAGVGDEHLTILAKVAAALDDQALLEKLSTSPTKEEIFNALK